MQVCSLFNEQQAKVNISPNNFDGHCDWPLEGKGLS